MSKITNSYQSKNFSAFFKKISLTQQDCPFKSLIDTWLDFCWADGLSPKTLHDYSDKVGRFYWWWKYDTHYSQTIGEHPKNVSDKELRLFVGYLREPNTHRWGQVEGKELLSPYTVAAYGRPLKVFFSWLIQERHISETPFNRSVRFTPRKKDRVIKSVGVQDLAKIFATLNNPVRHSTFAGIRDVAIISLLLDSGIRRGELLSLEIENLDLVRLRCIVVGKTGQRYAYFSDQCKAVISEYLKYRLDIGEDGPLWLTIEGQPLGHSSFSSIIRRLEKQSGVRFHAHQFRHTFALMMSSKVSTFELMDMMGHSSVSTTQWYVKNNPDRVGQAHRFNSPLNTLQDELPGMVKRGRPRKIR